jgi:hypothetical protein
MLPEALVLEVQSLSSEGVAIELSESGGMACVLLPRHNLPRGFSKVSSDLLLRLPLSYRNGKPDMFWLETDVVLADGTVPKSAESIEEYLGRKWRRFSWHLVSWDPARDDVRAYVRFVDSRLSRVV